MMRSAVTAIRCWVDKHPVKSSALMYGTMYTLAEVSQQKISSSITSTNSSPSSSSLSPAASLAASSSKSSLASHSLDVSSVKRYAIMGTFVFPPLLTRWYSWLDGRFPCTSGAVVSKKLLLDQFIFTPWVVVIFYVGMAWLEGKQGQDRWLELQQKGVTTFLLDCLFWLPVQFMNFMFIPPWLRVGFIGVMTFLWLNVLAYIKAIKLEPCEM